MTTTETKIQKFCSAFSSAKRDSGDRYWKLRDGLPEDDREAFTAAIYAAHEAYGMGDAALPSDWVYAVIALATDDPDMFAADDDGDIARRNFACGWSRSMSSYDLYSWAAESGHNRAWIDDAFTAYVGGESHESAIYAAIEEAIVNILAAACSVLCADED